MVIIAVVLIVVGLGVTAVYRLRDASNRIKCQGNLIAIGIGLHGFHDATGHFPAATVPNPSLPAEKRLSWLSAMPGLPRRWSCQPPQQTEILG